MSVLHWRTNRASSRKPATHGLFLAPGRLPRVFVSACQITRRFCSIPPSRAESLGSDFTRRTLDGVVLTIDEVVRVGVALDHLVSFGRGSDQTALP